LSSGLFRRALELGPLPEGEVDRFLGARKGQCRVGERIGEDDSRGEVEADRPKQREPRRVGAVLRHDQLLPLPREGDGGPRGVDARRDSGLALVIGEREELFRQIDVCTVGVNRRMRPQEGNIERRDRRRDLVLRRLALDLGDDDPLARRQPPPVCGHVDDPARDAHVGVEHIEGADGRRQAGKRESERLQVQDLVGVLDFGVDLRKKSGPALKLLRARLQDALGREPRRRPVRKRPGHRFPEAQPDGGGRLLDQVLRRENARAGDGADP
jgi:hypothetical protein